MNQRGSSIQEVTDWLLFTEGADFGPAMFAGACFPARPCDLTLQTPGSQVTGGRAGRQETTGQAGGCESQERVVGSKVILIWFKGHMIRFIGHLIKNLMVSHVLGKISLFFFLFKVCCVLKRYGIYCKKIKQKGFA